MECYKIQAQYTGSQNRVNKQDKVSPMQVEILLLFDSSPFHPDPRHCNRKRARIAEVLKMKVRPLLWKTETETEFLKSGSRFLKKKEKKKKRKMISKAAYQNLTSHFGGHIPWKLLHPITQICWESTTPYTSWHASLNKHWLMAMPDTHVSTRDASCTGLSLSNEAITLRQKAETVTAMVINPIKF